ncbi:hypothetical protein ACIOWB_24235 [Pseudomonas capeferrum]|uniref:hypothetical protein n=1 Tax=Pseudomonas capeferrum TaxID=1495066 RepID=UPI003826ED00
MSEKQQTENEATEEELLSARVKRLQVPREALRDYLDRMRPGRRCTFCETGLYEAAPAPNGGTAGLVSTPVPHISGLGVWFYSATCTICGDTRLFHANMVRNAMSEEH